MKTNSQDKLNIAVKNVSLLDIGGGDTPLMLLLGGTKEGREIANLLVQEGHSVIVSVVNHYGRKLLPPGVNCREGRLNREELSAFIKKEQVQLVIDATHPFAVEISQNAIGVCQACSVKYLRFERESTHLPDSPLIHLASDFAEAARLAVRLGKRIFLTTGSSNLDVFVKESKRVGALIFARVLPLPSVIEGCLPFIPPAQLIALQGPYSKDFNQAIFQEYKADVMVAKESGIQGGTLAKIEAAVALGLPVVVIKRPVIDYPRRVNSYQELLTTIA